MYYYVGPWVWDTANRNAPHWRAPVGTVGLVDLRSIPAMSLAGGAPQGYGFFASTKLLGGEYQQFGTSLSSTIASANRIALQSQLGIGAIQSSSVLDVLWELLTLHADPTGELRWKPLRPTVGGRLELHLGGHSSVKSERWWPDMPEAALAIEVAKLDYARLRQAALAGVISPDHHRKVLSSWATKLRIPYRQLQGNLPDEPPIKPTTTITESFNTGDSDILGPDLSWTETIGDFDIVSNKAASQVEPSRARADSDLSSDDHYAESSGAGGLRPGAAVCFNAGADTCYASYRRGSDHRIEKIVAGTPTILATGGTAATTPIKTEKNGSTLKSYDNGVEQVSTTDSAITGNVRCGIWGGSNSAVIDSWEAADLAAAGQPTMRRWGGIPGMGYSGRVGW